MVTVKHGRRSFYLHELCTEGCQGRQVSQWAENHKDEIILFYLPPYSPEYNPDEYLNNDLKQNIGTQAMVQNVRELEAHTAAFMGRISEDSDHVKSYFDHPALDKYKLD